MPDPENLNLFLQGVLTGAALTLVLERLVFPLVVPLVTVQRRRAERRSRK